MAPRRGQSKGQRGQRSRPAEIAQPQQQEVPAADPAQGSAPTIIDPPTTPIRQVGPFRVPQYNPPPLAPRPASPSGEDFDFTEADAIPLSVPPAAGNLSSPVKRARAVGGNQNSLQRKSDLEVWGEHDEDIIGTSVVVILKFFNNNISITEAARKVWRSNVYDHYIITVNRISDPFSDQPQSIEFVFTCKSHTQNHAQPLRRNRMKAGDGTTKFLKDVKQCEEKQGIYQPRPASSSVPYTVENHRALIALRCAKHARPMNEILDDDYRTEVDMLRPGTVVPHPTTIQRDLINIYVHMSTFVMNYFLVGLIILSNIHFFGLKNIYSN